MEDLGFKYNMSISSSRIFFTTFQPFSLLPDSLQPITVPKNYMNIKYSLIYHKTILKTLRSRVKDLNRLPLFDGDSFALFK